jgi:hypothetical protein
LVDLRTVIAHDEYLPIRLRGIGIYRLVLVAHPSAGECDPLAVRGESAVAIITGRIREATQIFAVRTDAEDFVITVDLAGKCDDVPAR